MQIDFKNITPCGENCELCEHKSNNGCQGCKETDGKCVKMWKDGCYVYKCCIEHDVPFCGLCKEFPCKWLVTKGNWNPNIVKHQTFLAKEYKNIKD